MPLETSEKSSPAVGPSGRANFGIVNEMLKGYNK